MRSAQRRGDHIVTCAIEHKCVLETVAHMRRLGCWVDVLPVKQFVTYVLVQCGQRLLFFRRSYLSRAAEFLRGSKCIGFGGHVSAADADILSLGVRWNPVAREDQPVKSDGHTVIVSLPAGMKISDFGEENEAEEDLATKPDARYPVDKDQLGKMIAPCLIHMLDAHYSTLVMEKLAACKIEDFVGIHDCWFVPEWVDVEGVLSDGTVVLRKVLDEVNNDWYAGLGPIYERMLHYLRGDPIFEPRIRKARRDDASIHCANAGQ
jgi:hypothetical protein